MNPLIQSNYLLAIPGIGNLQQSTSQFLNDCGFSVFRPSENATTARIREIPEVEVVFVRSTDVVGMVQDGTVQLGITGYDLVQEHFLDPPSLTILLDDLKFGRATLELVVPEHWLHVKDIDDLTELSIYRQRENQTLRIATNLPRLTRNFLIKHNISNFSLVKSHASVAIAPGIGIADCIAELTGPHAEFNQYNLKQIINGTVFTSQACLIGNKTWLASKDFKPGNPLYQVIEFVHAYIEAYSFLEVQTAFVGEDEESLLKRIYEEEIFKTIDSIRISREYSQQQSTMLLNLRFSIPRSRVTKIVNALRSLGAQNITMLKPQYFFSRWE